MNKNPKMPKPPRLPMRREEYTVEFLLELLMAEGLIDGRMARNCLVNASQVRGRIEREQQARESSRKVRYRASPAEILSRMNLVNADGVAVDEDRIMPVIARHAKLPYRKIDPLKLNADLITETTTRPFARRHVCIPLERLGSKLTVAVDNPYDLQLIQTLRDVTQHDVAIVVASKTDILKSITEVYGFKQAVKGAVEELTQVGPNLSDLSQFVQLKDVDEIEATDRHVVNAVDYIFHYAFDQRASDIHIEPKRENSVVRMRIDGKLNDIYTMPRNVHAAMVSRIKMLARMDIAERRRPQDGRIKTERAGREIELRASTLPVAFGEKMVLRIFDPEILLQDLDALGFFPDDLKRWVDFINQPTGIILVTGPTGSGKTTTLYSTLNHIAKPELNLTTIEDPIEMIFEPFNQVLVQNKIDLTFAAILRTVLRQDPDVIMIGEIRDPETAQMAVQAALTGHLVFSTVHTNDAPSAITRLLDLDVEPFKIASTLIGVMAQRLVRMICDHCRAETVLTAEQVELLDINIAPGAEARLPVQYGEGCVRCRGTGLYGRTGIFELMPVNSTIRNLIKRNATAEEVERAARADGMHTLRERAIRKMASGETSFEEVASMLGDKG